MFIKKKNLYTFLKYFKAKNLKFKLKKKIKIKFIKF